MSARLRRLARALRARLPRRREIPSSWRLGDVIADADVERLVARGVRREDLGSLELRYVEGPFPEWWRRGGSRLLLAAALPVPEQLIQTVLQGRPRDALICLASDLSDAAYLLLDGDSPVVYIGPDSRFPRGELHCGGPSLMLLHGGVTCTARPTIDARNGGSIVAQRDQLWASDIIVSTDDMHAIRDVETSARVNSFGASIRVGTHVWLGRDVIVTGGATLGAHSVVGMRSLVRACEYPDHSVLAGTPARVVRSGVTWDRADLP